MSRALCFLSFIYLFFMYIFVFINIFYDFLNYFDAETELFWNNKRSSVSNAIFPLICSIFSKTCRVLTGRPEISFAQSPLSKMAAALRQSFSKCQVSVWRYFAKYIWWFCVKCGQNVVSNMVHWFSSKPEAAFYQKPMYKPTNLCAQCQNGFYSLVTKRQKCGL